MSYSVEDLLAIFRREVDDTEADYLWSDEDFFWYLDEAQKEFARETDIFKSSDLTIPLVAGDAFVDIPTGVEKIRSVVLDSTNKILPVVNFVEVRGSHTSNRYGSEIKNWTSQGSPQYIISDEVTDKIRIVPIPANNDSITLSAYTLPILEITDDGSSLDLKDSSHQRSLLMFCKAMAYEVHDSDTEDLQKADRYKRQFYAYTKMVKSRRNRRNRRVGTVKYGGL